MGGYAEVSKGVQSAADRSASMSLSTQILTMPHPCCPNRLAQRTTTDAHASGYASSALYAARSCSAQARAIALPNSPVWDRQRAMIRLRSSLVTSIGAPCPFGSAMASRQASRSTVGSTTAGRSRSAAMDGFGPKAQLAQQAASAARHISRHVYLSGVMAFAFCSGLTCDAEGRSYRRLRDVGQLIGVTGGEGHSVTRGATRDQGPWSNWESALIVAVDDVLEVLA